MDGVRRWITAYPKSYSVGPRQGTYSTYREPGRYRTQTQLTIRSSRGIVLKRSGWSQSSAVTFR